MPKAITYVGTFDAVEVDGIGVVASGESVTVADDLAKSLLEQTDNWQASKPASKPDNKEA